MSKEEIDGHFARAWQFENERNMPAALQEYDQGLAKLQIFYESAAPADQPALQGFGTFIRDL